MTDALLWVVRYEFVPGTAAARSAVLAEHREWIAGLVARGTLLGAGLTGEAEEGAQLLFSGLDEQGVRACLERDPYRGAGILSATSVLAWSVRHGAVRDLAARMTLARPAEGREV